MAWPLAALALLMLWVSVGTGLNPALDILLTHLRVQRWTPVQAQVVELRLLQARRSLDVQVLYRYEFQGRPHVASRVGVAPPGQPGDKAWVQARYDALEHAYQAGRSVTAWVDPTAPHRAVLDRELPLRPLVLHLPLALGLGLFGALLGGMAWLLATGGRTLTEVRAHAWQNAFLWVLALCWCGFAFPVTATMWQASQDLLSSVVLVVFDGIGLWLLWGAWADRPRRAGPAHWPWLLGLAVCTWGLLRQLALPDAPAPGQAAALAGPPPAPAIPAPAALPPELALRQALAADDAAQLDAALRAGASPDLRLSGGDTALIHAARQGALPLVDALLRHGAQVDTTDDSSSNQGDTALLVAAWRNHPPVFKRLLAAGASVQARNRWDWGAVHMAAQGGCQPCLESLALRGLPLDAPAPASRGETPAMLAAARGQLGSLQWLVQHGARLDAVDASGQDALAYARAGQQAATAHWLRQTHAATAQ